MIIYIKHDELDAIQHAQVTWNLFLNLVLLYQSRAAFVFQLFSLGKIHSGENAAENFFGDSKSSKVILDHCSIET